MNTYQILEPLVEEPIILAIQITVEENLLLPSEETRQFTQFGLPTIENEELSIASNVPKLIAPSSTFNVFGSLDWVAEQGWLLISK
jgi:hypothetical protein